MTKTAAIEDATQTETQGKISRKVKILIILIVLVAIGGAIGGTWYVMQDQEATEVEPKKKPTTFIELETFTVNLQPDDGHQYLQVGLTIKAQETDVVAAIKAQMPIIRNRILLLLSSKKASEISTITGKQQLSAEIADEIRQIFSSEDSAESHEEIIGVLFTSFVIQ
ncbi:MAG: flagellar basal body-associated protein FliL [Nitrosomonas sp.]|nr:flagellar basal body-associated protein FliL [Nitrosomonas sp.]MDP1949765.1 flagellar basal body-associated protein FliL [Nitrosomonas sp.]